jgi:hypothetical protein
MNTISEHELRERLQARGHDVDPAMLTSLADDALRQARRHRRTMRTTAALASVLVVAAIGVTANTSATHSQRSVPVATTSAPAGRHDPVELVTPIRFLAVASVSAGACTTDGYTGTSTAGTTTTVSCYHVETAQAMSVSEPAAITAMPVPTLQGQIGWEVRVTLLSTDKAAFTRLTTAAVNRQIAVVIDGKAVNAPLITDPITSGTYDITGYTQQSATDLVDQLTGR